MLGAEVPVTPRTVPAGAGTPKSAGTQVPGRRCPGRSLRRSLRSGVSPTAGGGPREPPGPLHLQSSLGGAAEERVPRWREGWGRLPRSRGSVTGPRWERWPARAGSRRKMASALSPGRRTLGSLSRSPGQGGAPWEGVERASSAGVGRGGTGPAAPVGTVGSRPPSHMFRACPPWPLWLPASPPCLLGRWARTCSFRGRG